MSLLPHAPFDASRETNHVEGFTLSCAPCAAEKAMLFPAPVAVAIAERINRACGLDLWAWGRRGCPEDSKPERDDLYSVDNGAWAVVAVG